MTGLIVMAVLAVSGLVLSLLAMPLVKRRVKPNAWYGVRLPIAYESDANWYALNEVGGMMLMLAGMAIMLASPLCLLVNAEQQPLLFTVVAVAPTCLALGLALVRMLAFARKLRHR